MSRTWLLFLSCLVLLVLLGPLSRAALSLRVNESAIKVLFEEQGTRVVLPIESALGRPTEALVKVEILNTDNPIAAAERDFTLRAGTNEVTIPITLSLKQLADNTQDLLWYRLRYSIAPAASAEFDKTSNVVSLSQITPDIFNVNVAAARRAQPGSSYRLRVKTAHPLTSKPVSGTSIEAQIKFDGLDRPDILLKQTARTDSTGFATLDFQIPRDVEDDEGKIKVTATRGVLSQTAEDDPVSARSRLEAETGFEPGDLSSGRRSHRDVSRARRDRAREGKRARSRHL